MTQVYEKNSVFTLRLMLVLAFVVGVSGSVLAQEAVDGGELPVLSLDDCVRIALQDSPTLLISDERRHIAAKDVDAAYGAFLPDLTVGRTWNKSKRTDFDVAETVYGVAGYYRIYENQNFTGNELAVPVGVPIPTGNLVDNTITTTYKDYTGRANLNVFAGGSKFSGLSSAKHSLKAATETVGYTRELVAEDVIAAYFNLLRYNKLLEVALETQEQAAKELERTETYFRLGSSAKSDVLQQRVRLENTKLDVVVADNTVKKAFADLAYSMNRPLASGFAVDERALTTQYEVESLSALYTEALAARRDLKSREHNRTARKRDVTSSTATLLPRVDLFAHFSRSTNELPPELLLGSQESGVQNYGYSVSWNIFDRGQTLTNRSKAKASARIAEYELEQARMNVQVEIRQLHNSQVEARERAHVSAETIIQSEEELRLAQERFRVGAGTALDVIVAQVNLANSRGQEVQAMCDFLIAETMMERAVGRLDKWSGGE